VVRLGSSLVFRLLLRDLLLLGRGRRELMISNGAVLDGLGLLFRGLGLRNYLFFFLGLEF
jgi:hypothetical protein